MIKFDMPLLTPALKNNHEHIVTVHIPSTQQNTSKTDPKVYVLILYKLSTAHLVRTRMAKENLTLLLNIP